MGKAKPKCMRMGRLTNNGFLNYMREFRRCNCGMSMLRSTKEGAKCWRKLSDSEKEKYRNLKNKTMACCKPKKKKKRLPCCKPKKKKQMLCCKPKKKIRLPCCAPPKKKCRPCKAKDCSKPGPVMNSGYLNFIRTYRREHCGLKPKDLIMKAARAWSRMSEDQKFRYRRMACKVTKSPRHKYRRICTGN